MQADVLEVSAKLLDALRLAFSASTSQLRSGTPGCFPAFTFINPTLLCIPLHHPHDWSSSSSHKHYLFKAPERLIRHSAQLDHLARLKARPTVTLHPISPRIPPSQ